MIALVRRARRRFLCNELFSQGAIAASAGLLAFILLLLTGTQVLNWHWVVLIPLGAIAYGVYRTRQRVPGEYRVAQLVDYRLQLADVISTALFFSEGEPAARVNPEIRRLQAERADQIAASVDVRRAVPYTMPRAAYAMVALLLVAGSIFGLRYGLTRRLDLQQPLASILQQSLGYDTPVQQAKNQKRMRQPDPVTETDESGQNAQEPDQKAGDQQEAESANTEEASESQKPTGDQKAGNGEKKEGDEGEKAEGDANESQGDERSAEGEDGSSTKASDGKSDQKQDGNAKQDSNNAGENSSLMSKVKDFAQNLLSKVKPQQNQSGTQQAPGDQKNSQSKGQQNGKQQPGKEGQQQNGGQQGESQEGQAGEQAQNSQDPQGKGTGKSDAQQASKQPGSGVGSQDGDKSIKQAADLAAMGKISEILGKRSATITGESTVEVQSTSQQLHTPYAQRGSQHSQGGTEIRRDEVPVALQPYVEQYFEQVRKQAPAGTAPAPPPAAKK